MTNVSKINVRNVRGVMKVIRENGVLVTRSSLSKKAGTALEGFSGAEVIRCRRLKRWSWSMRDRESCRGSRRGGNWDLGKTGGSSGS